MYILLSRLYNLDVYKIEKVMRIFNEYEMKYAHCAIIKFVDLFLCINLERIATNTGKNKSAFE